MNIYDFLLTATADLTTRGGCATSVAAAAARAIVTEFSGPPCDDFVDLRHRHSEGRETYLRTKPLIEYAPDASCVRCAWPPREHRKYR